ncbi:hypothetical protein ABLV94_07305 [Staphylococcus sp. Mo2-7]
MSKKLRLNLQHFAEQGDNPQGEPDTDNQTDENLEGKDDRARRKDVHTRRG